METEVLIVVPTLGERIQFLRLALDSIVSQKITTKIVVIHPKSVTKNMLPIMHAYSTVVFEAQDLSMVESVNYVIKKNHYIKYCNWLGDDDMLGTDAIQNALTVLKKYPTAAGVFGKCRYVNENGIRLGKYNPPKFAAKICGFIPAAIKLEGGLMRTDFFIQAGGINPDFKLCPDVDIVLKLRKLGGWIKVDNNELSIFRIHSDSTTFKMRRAGIFEAQQIQKNLGSSLDKFLVTLFGSVIREMKMLIFLVLSNAYFNKIINIRRSCNNHQ